jgi:hypothetical protein
MEIVLDLAEELIRKQMVDQGCQNDNLSDLQLLQPHLAEWIEFFNIENRFANATDTDSTKGELGGKE